MTLRTAVSEKKPRVSIGLPVYNGENYLGEVIESILAQTFKDFELIISDNASTDRTEKICREYVAMDSRVRYYCNEKNLGAAKNYNRVFELSSGEYFKWAAHDDICAPEYLQRCVEILDRDVSVVLCYPRTIIIDENNHNDIKTFDGLHLSSPKPHERYKRYHECVRYGHTCHPVFGVIRANILRQTSLIGCYVSSDRVLLGELALYGKFYEVPEFLFFKRHHPQMSIQAHQSPRSRAGWFDPTKEGKLQLVGWIMLFEYLDAIKRAPISWREKAMCRLQVGKWFICNLKWLGRNVILAVIWPFLPRSLKIQSRKEIRMRKSS